VHSIASNGAEKPFLYNPRDAKQPFFVDRHRLFLDRHSRQDNSHSLCAGGVHAAVQHVRCS
jgi:hypothetical protein